jgi:hypothetical protein
MPRLATTAEDKRQAREVLFRLLTGHPTNEPSASMLADLLSALDPTAEEKRSAREVLRQHLGQGKDTWGNSRDLWASST